MARKTIVKSVQEYLQYVNAQGIPVSYGVLFGSRVKNKAHKWSDIDVLVVSPHFDEVQTAEDHEKLWMFAARTNKLIEPIPVGKKQYEENKSSLILEAAHREGQIIYLETELPASQKKTPLRKSKRFDADSCAAALWNTALSDFDGAEDLIRGRGSFGMGLFIVHAALQRAFYAKICRQTRAAPPRSADLIKLAKTANFVLSKEQRQFCQTMNFYHKEGLYLGLEHSAPSLEQAEEYLIRAKTLIASLQEAAKKTLVRREGKIIPLVAKNKLPLAE